MHHCKFEKIEEIQKIIDNQIPYEDIFNFVNNLINRPWCESIKLGSEVEDNSFEELQYVKTNFAKKLRFKIGGSGAKNDIRQALKTKVDVITLPMAESRYAIENFLEIVEKNIYKDYNPLYAMNIETKTIVNNLPLVKDLLGKFSSFTIGRSDLSGSMGVNVNSIEVDNIIEDIISFIKLNFPNAKISIGGKITPQSSHHLIEKFGKKVEFINTKFFYMDILKIDNIKEVTNEILQLEIALFALFYKNGFRSKEELLEFSLNNIKRMNS
ncbi:MAG: hypothetical protein WH035_05710 [Spirochaetota bacterium]